MSCNDLNYYTDISAISPIELIQYILVSTMIIYLGLEERQSLYNIQVSNYTSDIKKVQQVEGHKKKHRTVLMYLLNESVTDNIGEENGDRVGLKE